MTYLNILSKRKDGFFKSVGKFERIPTDTWVFRLHYKLAVILVIIYSVVFKFVNTDDQITCFGAPGSDVDIAPVNDYCFTKGTFTMAKSDPLYGEVYPGVYSQIDDSEEVREQKQYKWMQIYAIIMIILLLTPRYFWRWFENGNMSRLLDKLHGVYVLGRDSALNEEKDKLVNYLVSHLGYHRRYAIAFISGEVLNVGVSSILFWMWDNLSEHQLSIRGGASGYFGLDQLLGSSPLERAFPNLGKCTAPIHGPGGSPIPMDFVCVLPLNAINQPAAIFFWYFFMVLLTIGLASLVFRLAIIFSTRVRIFLLASLTPMTSLEDICLLTGSCSYSDWFVIYQIGKALEPMIFQEVVKGVIQKLKLTEV